MDLKDFAETQEKQKIRKCGLVGHALIKRWEIYVPWNKRTDDSRIEAFSQDSVKGRSISVLTHF
jgi:hypothetical protein